MDPHPGAPSAAIIVAGGSATRFGADKLAEPLGARTVLDWVLDALGALEGCAAIVVAGPPRATGNRHRGAAPLHFVDEVPAGGGPLAGIAAAMGELERIGVPDRVWVLAGDQPLIGGALAELSDGLDRDPRTEVAVLVDGTGRQRVLAALWRAGALRTRLAALAPHHGGAVRSLYRDVDAVEVTDRGNWSADCDTPAELEALRRALRANERRRG